MWSACEIRQTHLAITGTDDNFYQPHVNSLKIAEKIPGAWLVQIKNAGHAIVNQYPAEVGKIMNTFLSTTDQNSTAMTPISGLKLIDKQPQRSS